MKLEGFFLLFYCLEQNVLFIGEAPTLPSYQLFERYSTAANKNGATCLFEGTHGLRP